VCRTKIEMSHWGFGRRSRFAEGRGAKRNGDRRGTAPRNLRWVVSLSATPWMVGGGLVRGLDGSWWLGLRFRFEGAGRDFRPREDMSTEGQSESAIQQLAHHDFLSRQGPRLMDHAQRKDAVAPRHRPVVLDHACFLVTQHVVQLQPARKRPMQIGKRPRGDVELRFNSSR